MSELRRFQERLEKYFPSIIPERLMIAMEREMEVIQGLILDDKNTDEDNEIMAILFEKYLYFSYLGPLSYIISIQSFERQMENGNIEAISNYLEITTIERPDNETLFEFLCSYDKLGGILSMAKNTEALKQSIATKNYTDFIYELNRLESKELLVKVATYLQSNYDGLGENRKYYEKMCEGQDVGNGLDEYLYEVCKNEEQLMETYKDATIQKPESGSDWKEILMAYSRVGYVEFLFGLCHSIFHLGLSYAEKWQIREIISNRNKVYDDILVDLYKNLLDKENNEFEPDTALQYGTIEEMHERLLEFFENHSEDTEETEEETTLSDDSEQQANETPHRLERTGNILISDYILGKIHGELYHALEDIINYLGENGYIQNDLPTKARLASYMTGYRYEGMTSNEPIKWLKMVDEQGNPRHPKELFYLLKHMIEGEVKYDVVYKTFELGERKAGYNPSNKAESAKKEFRDGLEKLGVREKSKYRERKK